MLSPGNPHILALFGNFYKVPKLKVIRTWYQLKARGRLLSFPSTIINVIIYCKVRV
jgi:hypothetical protein